MRRLVSYLRSESFHQSRIGIRTLAIRLTVTALVIGLAFTSIELWKSRRSELGIDLPRVNWLPGSATNVSYYRSKSQALYEFNIDEIGFGQWVKDHGWEVTNIVQPQQVLTYRCKVDGAPAESYSIIITDGLMYRAMQPNGGGLTIAYVRASMRAYYEYESN